MFEFRQRENCDDGSSSAKKHVKRKNIAVSGRMRKTEVCVVVVVCIPRLFELVRKSVGLFGFVDYNAD